MEGGRRVRGIIWEYLNDDVSIGEEIAGVEGDSGRIFLAEKVEYVGIWEIRVSVGLAT